MIIKEVNCINFRRLTEALSQLHQRKQRPPQTREEIKEILPFAGYKSVEGRRWGARITAQTFAQFRD